MMRSAPLAFDPSQQQVEAMMEQGTTFSDVERVIDASGLSSVHKAALWLLAWSLRDVEHQRRDARLTLAAVGADELGGWRCEQTVNSASAAFPIARPRLSAAERVERPLTV